MIETKDLQKVYDNAVLKYPDFTANKGDFVLICGASGTGKSTLCEMIAKFISQSSGEILLNKMDINKLNVFENIHYLSQFPDHNLIGPTCFEEVELWLRGQESIGREQKRSGDFQSSSSHLDKFLLSDMIDRPIWKLSFGKKKALAFCCLDMINRDVWVLDEPFAGLDAEIIEVTKNMFHEFIGNGGIIIATSHTDKGFEEFKTKCLFLYYSNSI